MACLPSRGSVRLFVFDADRFSLLEQARLAFEAELVPDRAALVSR